MSFFHTLDKYKVCILFVLWQMSVALQYYVVSQMRFKELMKSSGFRYFMHQHSINFCMNFAKQNIECLHLNLELKKVFHHCTLTDNILCRVKLNTPLHVK